MQQIIENSRMQMPKEGENLNKLLISALHFRLTKLRDHNEF